MRPTEALKKYNAVGPSKSLGPLGLTLIGTTVHNLSTRVTKGIAALEKIIR